jgi:tetratricopeptide (TPR) repeat protein
MSTAKALKASDATTPRGRIDIAIEVLTLAAVIVVPLAFQGREMVAFFESPKFFTLHFIALSIPILWGIESYFNTALNQRGTSLSLFDRVDAWLAAARHRWAMVAAVGLGIAFIISTLLSPSPWVSVWGREFGDLGYELYSSLSFLVLFFAVALRTKSRQQVMRIVFAIVAAGILSAAYGLVQVFEWDPFGWDLKNFEGIRRVISSFGNPVFFGAYLVMTIPLFIAVSLYQEMIGRRWAIVPAVIGVGISLAALWHTGGRGAIISSTFAVVLFIAISALWIDRKTFVKAIGLSVAGVFAAVLIIQLPGGETRTGRGVEAFRNIFSQVTDSIEYIVGGTPAITIPTSPTNPEDAIADSSVTPTTTAVPVTEPGDRDAKSLSISPLDAIPEGDRMSLSLAVTAGADILGPADSRGGALSGRADYWRGALKLSLDRKTVSDESSLMKGLRVMFGFGPDMYFYSHPLTSAPKQHLTTTSHTHNYPLQILMEQGLTGLVAMIATAFFVLLAATQTLIRKSKSGVRDPWILLILAGALAALGGRAMEQMTGVGRVSDLMLFWVLMGLVFAIAEIGRREFEEVSGSSVSTRKVRLSNFDAKSIAPPVAILIVGVVFAVIFVQKDVAVIRAGWLAANGFEQKSNGQASAAFNSFEQAADLAPDVERYVIEATELLVQSANRSEDRETSIALLTEARGLLFEYEKRDPNAWQTQLRLAQVTASFVDLGLNELTPEMVARYIRIADLMQPYPEIQALAAEVITIAGEWELGIVMAERSITLGPNVGPLAQAWWARGEALYQLGRSEEARLSFETAIDRDPTAGLYAGRSHRGLALLFSAEGDPNSAAAEHKIADRIEKKLR